MPSVRNALIVLLIDAVVESVFLALFLLSLMRVVKIQIPASSGNRIQQLLVSVKGKFYMQIYIYTHVSLSVLAQIYQQNFPLLLLVYLFLVGPNSNSETLQNISVRYVDA